MITYLMLGQHGRLGNQMFQYALLCGIFKKNGYLFAIPNKNHQLSDCFDIKCKAYNFEQNSEKIIKNMNFYREKYFHFNDNIFQIKDNVIYAGNFQSEKYFEHCREFVRDQFSFKREIYDKSLNYIQKEKENFQQIVSVHVRRGDYLYKWHLNSHPVCTIDWYLKCFQYFNKQNTKFMIFSDDIEWCKQNFNQDYAFSFSSLSSHYEDLCAMSLCDHNIIANSSFSWWGAWLNKNKEKKTLAPQKWFGPSYYYHQTKDLYPQDWIIL